MSKEKFILVSLKEEDSKKLAQIITNDTSRKILDFLSEKDSTESELAKALNMPISTVHYNLQALVKGRLVEADEYHYSEKGKEVLHYKLANKYIIIAPKSTHGIKEKLKSILPVALISIGFAFVFALTKFFSGFFMAASNDLEAPKALLQATVEDMAAGEAIPEAAPTAARMITEPAKQFIMNDVFWFTAGILLVIIIYIIIALLKKGDKVE